MSFLPQSDSAILLARGYGSNCTTGGNWSGCAIAFLLLTWHGTLLCRLRQGGGLVHRPPAPVSDDVEPVVLDLPIEQLQPGFGLHLRATLPELPANPPGELQRFRLQWAGDQRTVTLRHEAAFLSADPNSDRVTLFRTEAGGMETFLPLSPVDLDALRLILSSSWLIRSSGVLVERPTTGRLFHLHVGDLAADLRFQLPFDLASWPDRLTLLATAGGSTGSVSPAR